MQGTRRDGDGGDRTGAAPLPALRRLLTLLSASYGRRDLLLMLGLGAAASLAEGAGLLLLVPVLDLVGVGGAAPPPADTLLTGLGLYLLLVTAAAALVAVRSILSHDQRTRFVDRLRGDLHRALLHVAWPVFQGLRAASVKQIITGEVGRLGLCHDALVNLGVAGLTLPTLLLAALILSPALTLVTLCLSCLALLLIRRIGRSGFDIGLRMGRAHQEMMGDVSDDLAGLRIIKGFEAETLRADNLSRRFADLRRLQTRHTRIQTYEQAALLVMAALMTATAVMVAVIWLQQPLSEALVVILAFARLAQRSLAGLRFWRMLETSLPALVLYEEMLDRLRAGAEPPAGGDHDLPLFSRTLSFRDVSLCMPDGRQALDGIDLELSFGALLAVTGPSGAGKSSLADLAAGLAYPTAGTLSVDGTLLTPTLLSAWRRQVAVVPQDPFLFHDTIRANLLLATPQATETDLWTAQIGRAHV